MQFLVNLVCFIRLRIYMGTVISHDQQFSAVKNAGFRGLFKQHYWTKQIHMQQCQFAKLACRKCECSGIDILTL
jgi:hypothetical protein